MLKKIHALMALWVLKKCGTLRSICGTNIKSWLIKKTINHKWKLVRSPDNIENLIPKYFNKRLQPRQIHHNPTYTEKLKNNTSW